MIQRLSLVLGFALVAPASAATNAPDFTAAHSELVQNLRNFVRVDTSNPPGNETRGAEFLKAILEHEGIACETVALDPARANLIARLKGNGRKQPILLMGHLDVVG